MNIQSANSLLEKEWEQPSGFLGSLRVGHFDSEGLERLLHILRSVEIEDAIEIDRTFVRLTWFIPLFMTWQRERVQEQGGNVEELDAAFHKVLNALYETLGVP